MKIHSLLMTEMAAIVQNNYLYAWPGYKKQKDRAFTRPLLKNHSLTHFLMMYFMQPLLQPWLVQLPVFVLFGISQN